MGLGRDETKHLICRYHGNEDECPNVCEKCSIAMKMAGDAAIKNRDIVTAMHQYKRALFINPNYADAWCDLGYSYEMIQEYNNALNSFNKAIAIDPTYGNAMYGKVLALLELKKNNEALTLLNMILELYDDENVINLKNSLLQTDKTDSEELDLLKALEQVTEKANDLIKETRLYNSRVQFELEKESNRRDVFGKHIYEYCFEHYKSFGDKRVWSASIISTFYGAICLTLDYYKKPMSFLGIDPYVYISFRYHIEELDKNAERLLSVLGDQEKSSQINSIISSYVDSCIPIFMRINSKKDVYKVVCKAIEHAFVIGSLLALSYSEAISRINGRHSIDIALEKLEESAKDYNYTQDSYNYPRIGDLRIDPKTYDDVPQFFKCTRCGKSTFIKAHEQNGEEKRIIERYRELACRFVNLGYPTEFLCLCDECYDRLFPSGSRERHNFVFSIRRPGYINPIISFPQTLEYIGFDYHVTLLFLEGIETIAGLSIKTNTHLEAQAYLDSIHKIIGDVSDKS